MTKLYKTWPFIQKRLSRRRRGKKRRWL